MEVDRASDVRAHFHGGTIAFRRAVPAPFGVRKGAHERGALCVACTSILIAAVAALYPAVIMKVRDVLRRKGRTVATLEASQPLAAAIRCFLGSKVRALVITETGSVVGMLAIRDVLAQLDRRGGGALERPVNEAMSSDVISLGPESSLEDAHGLFTQHGINHLPVIHEGELMGLVTPVDVLSDHVKELDEQRELLHAYVTSSVL